MKKHFIAGSFNCFDFIKVLLIYDLRSRRCGRLPHYALRRTAHHSIPCRTLLAWSSLTSLNLYHPTSASSSSVISLRNDKKKGTEKNHSFATYTAGVFDGLNMLRISSDIDQFLRHLTEVVRVSPKLKRLHHMNEWSILFKAVWGGVSRKLPSQHRSRVSEGLHTFFTSIFIEREEEAASNPLGFLVYGLVLN